MPVEAVVAQIQLAADKPLCPGQIPLQHFVPRLEPVEFLRDISPERLRVFDGLLIHSLVLFKALDVGSLRKLFRRGKDAIFAESRFEILIGEG